MRWLLLLILLLQPVIVSAEHINDTIGIEGNNTSIVYDANIVKTSQAPVVELQKNITNLQNELDRKNKLLAEYITYKKENIELQKNISKLKSKISMLEAENGMLREQNEQYKDLITDLISKQGNETKEGYISAYNEWKKDIGNFKTATMLGVIACLVIGIMIVKAKQKYEIPL